MIRIQLFKEGQKIENLSKWQEIALDILNSSISRFPKFKMKLGQDLQNIDEIDFDMMPKAIDYAIETREMESWGKWLGISIDLTMSLKQLNLVTSLSDFMWCIDIENRIYAKFEMHQFDPKFGNSYGIVNMQLYQTSI